MHRKDYILITVLSLYFFVFGNWVLSITSLDEGRNLDATLRMIESGNFLIPFYNCDYRFEKPPMLYWLTSISFMLFGVNEFSARLVSGLAATGISLLVYRWSYELLGRERALYASIIFSTLLHIWVEARAAVPEMLLTLFMSLSLYAFFKERFTLGWLLGGLAFLTKGPVGILLPVAVYLLWRRELRFISVKGVLVFLAVGTSWYLLMFINFGYEYFYKFFIYENVMRYTGAKSLHPRPFYFYLLVIAFSALLYLPLFPKLLRRGHESLLLWWLGLVFVFFSLSQNKLHHYILFLYPPLAILLASVASIRYMRVSLLLSVVLIPLLYLYALNVEKERFVPEAVSLLKDLKDRRLYFYRYENSAVVFYTRRCIERKEEFQRGDLIITKEEKLKNLKGYRVLRCGKEFEGKVCLIEKL